MLDPVAKAPRPFVAIRLYVPLSWYNRGLTLIRFDRRNQPANRISARERPYDHTYGTRLDANEDERKQVCRA